MDSNQADLQQQGKGYTCNSCTFASQSKQTQGWKCCHMELCWSVIVSLFIAQLSHLSLDYNTLAWNL